MTLEVQKNISISAMKERLQKDIDAAISQDQSVSVPLNALKQKMKSTQDTKQALAAALKETATQLPVNPKIDLLKKNLQALAAVLDTNVTPPAQAETAKPPAVPEKQEAAAPIVTHTEAEGVKVNAPVLGSAVETVKQLPEVMQIPLIGGALYLGSKLVSSIMKMFGAAGQAVAKPVDYAAHVFGEVGLWSGTWLLLSQLYTKFSGKPSESH